MKVNKSVLMVIVMTILLFGQSRYPGELWFKNVPTSATVSLVAQTAAWDSPDNDYSVLTDSYYLNITLFGGTSSYFLDFISNDAPGTGPDGTVAYTKYKVTKGSYYFYLDYRDCNYCTGDQDYTETDIEIEWDNTLNKFKRRIAESQNYNTIDNGETITAWGDDFTDPGYSPDNTCFQPTNPSGLTKLSDYNGHPRFTWNASEPDDATYNVWRRLGTGFYTKIASNQTSPTYIDYTVSTSLFGDQCRYKIQGERYGKTSPGYSNVILYYVWNSRELSESPDIPINYVLQQNYPNPFNPVTSIMFDLPEYSSVQINIYNALGQLVASPVNGDVSSGYREIKWNGTDNIGNSVANGVYLYTITAKSLENDKVFSDKKKMILLK